jgi:3-methyladenine DNA glycosylase Mpg
MILREHFYRRADVLAISQELIAKFLCSYIDEVVWTGMIIKTEVYKGVEDRACHTFGNRRTKRTEVSSCRSAPTRDCRQLRIGVEYAGDDALKPWRYTYKPSAD